MSRAVFYEPGSSLKGKESRKRGAAAKRENKAQRWVREKQGNFQLKWTRGEKTDLPRKKKVPASVQRPKGRKKKIPPHLLEKGCPGCLQGLEKVARPSSGKVGGRGTRNPQILIPKRRNRKKGPTIAQKDRSELRPMGKDGAEKRAREASTGKKLCKRRVLPGASRSVGSASPGTPETIPCLAKKLHLQKTSEKKHPTRSKRKPTREVSVPGKL